jgi:endonuclease/exonuclease/phosphatase family metal-dependent hydrolase
MAFYYKLDNNNPVDRRTATRLISLKKALKERIPARTIESTLLIATWNIREFDSSKYGSRSKECLHYIAEIVSTFDLVAIQEVNRDLTALNALMKILGGWWKFVITDTTQGKEGNNERSAFVFDSRKLSFSGLAGEIVLPTSLSSDTPTKQFYRTPYVIGFKSGWFSFEICTVHIVYGEDRDDDPNRIREIEEICNFLVKESKDPYAWSKNWILLGDFNIFQLSDKTFNAIIKSGFIVPEETRLPTNILKKKYFDQIAFILRDEASKALTEIKAGVFDYYDYIYSLEDEALYAQEMGEPYSKIPTPQKKTTYYKTWRTYQMSDHLPKWIEIKIDFGEEYLSKKAKE